MNYTSVEQSKKLLEFGLSSKTADMSYRFHTGYGEYYPSFGGTQKDSDIPCWTVGALLEAMPIIIRKDKRHYYTLHIIGHRKVIYAKIDVFFIRK